MVENVTKGISKFGIGIRILCQNEIKFVNTGKGVKNQMMIGEIGDCLWATGENNLDVYKVKWRKSM